MIQLKGFERIKNACYMHSLNAAQQHEFFVVANAEPLLLYGTPGNVPDDAPFAIEAFLAYYDGEAHDQAQCPGTGYGWWVTDAISGMRFCKNEFYLTKEHAIAAANAEILACGVTAYITAMQTAVTLGISPAYKQIAPAFPVATAAPRHHPAQGTPRGEVTPNNVTPTPTGVVARRRKKTDHRNQLTFL